MYTSISTLLRYCRETGKSLFDAVIEDETELTGKTREEILGELSRRFSVMSDSATRALSRSPSHNLISGQSSRQLHSGGVLVDSSLNEAMALSLSCCEVNASMGLICAAPTAGSCGIIPAVLIYCAKRLSSSRDKIIEALAVAGGVGAVITRNATVSGAKGGCQAECGSAAAMAAAAACHLAGACPETCANAAAIALINCMGLVCDPVAGLVQLPCSFRNASQTVNALISADMALAGQKSAIPADEVINAMYRVGLALPHELKETALGGIAATETAKKIEDELLG